MTPLRIRRSKVVFASTGLTPNFADTHSSVNKQYSPLIEKEKTKESNIFSAKERSGEAKIVGWMYQRTGCSSGVVIGSASITRTFGLIR
jgi:hypothetical protein